MAYRDVIVADGPQRYFMLGESSGSVAVDQMGVGNGVYQGAHTKGVTGPIAGITAVSFGPTLGYVEVALNRILSSLPNASVEMWVNIPNTAADRDLYAEAPPSGANLWKVASGNQRLSFLHIDDASTFYVTETGDIADGTWHHVVVTKAGTTIDLYRDAVDIGGGTMTGTDSFSASNTEAWIGGDPSFNQTFDHSIGHVAIYDYALSPSQITAHYNAAGVSAKTATDSAVGADAKVTSGNPAQGEFGASSEPSSTVTMGGVDETGVGTETAIVTTPSMVTAKTSSETATGADTQSGLGIPPAVVPVLRWRIDWDNDGNFGGGLEDLAGRVLECSFDRGRSADFSAEMTGSATLLLDNFDDRYTPEAPVGGLTPDQIVPGRPVHGYSTFNGVDYPHFFGYIERITPNYADRTVSIKCYDPLRRYQETDVVVAAHSFVQRSARDMRVAVLDEAERGTRNLLPNPSFEANLIGWTDQDGFAAKGTATRLTSDAAPGGGSACVEIVATLADFVYSSRARLAPIFFVGQVYRFSVWLRSVSGAQSVKIGMLVNRTGMPTNPQIAPQTVAIDGAWRRYSVTFVNPATTTGSVEVPGGFAVPVTGYVASTGAQTFRMDAAAITRGQALFPYADAGAGRWPSWCGNGSFDGGALNGWYDGWTNLVTNPSFEVDTSGWLADGGGAFDSAGSTLTRSTSDPLFGTARANMTSFGGGGGIYRNLSGTFRAGQTYHFSVWAKDPGNVASLHRLFLGSSGTPADSAQALLPAIQMNNWVKYSGTWTPTADRVDAQLAFTTGTNITDMQLDGFMVMRLDLAAVTPPPYADIGPGGGGSFVTTRAISTTAKYGSRSHQFDTPAIASAGRLYDFAHLGGYFVSGQPYTAAVWIRPTSSMPYKVGVAAAKADGTFDETSTTGTAPANVWTQVTVTWAPTADRPTFAPFGVVLYIYQTDATARTVLIDGVRVIPGSTADAFEEAHWQLGPEPDVYSSSAALSDSALGALGTLNGLTLTRHWIQPTMSAPFYRYVARSRDELAGKVVAETWNETVSDLSGFDIDRASLINIVPVSYLGGTEYYSDAESVAKYGPKPGASINGSTFFPDRTVPDIVGPALLARYKEPRGRPNAVRENLWPSHLQRDLDELVAFNFDRLKIVGGRYLILRLSTRISESGQRWVTTYALEDHAY